MNLIIAFMLTCACALSCTKYQSDLHKNVQAAFYEEAQRAYRDIVSYDENASVSQDEIVGAYMRKARFYSVRKRVSDFLEKIDQIKPRTPKEYAEKCIYEGKILSHPPEGVIFVRAFLMPFSPDEAKMYDDIQKSGDLQALDALFSPLEERFYQIKNVYTPENGFEPYFSMQDDSSIVPCARGVLYLTENAALAAMRLSAENPFSPPVRDARGIIAFEFVSD